MPVLFSHGVASPGLVVGWSKRRRSGRARAGSRAAGPVVVGRRMGDGGQWEVRVEGSGLSIKNIG